MNKILEKPRHDRKVATVIEYGYIAALIAAVAIAGLTMHGTNGNARFNSLGTSVPRAR